jgi:hypothetical protein
MRTNKKISKKIQLPGIVLVGELQSLQMTICALAHQDRAAVAQIPEPNPLGRDVRY